jgi:hypothetical protein
VVYINAFQRNACDWAYDNGNAKSFDDEINITDKCKSFVGSNKNYLQELRLV